MTPYFRNGFIILWLTAQITIPFVRTFDLQHGGYRYALFSWAMYSKPAVIYDVSLFRIAPSGHPEAIPDIKQFVEGYRSPQPMRMREYYRSETEIKKRLVDLVTHIAQKQHRAGYRYGASIRWIRALQADEPVQWDYITPTGLS